MAENHLICFSSASHAVVQARLSQSATRFNMRVRCYTQRWLRHTEFYRTNRRILDQSRLAGYDLWKPYIILETLRSIPKHDIVAYLDCDHVLTDKLDTVLDLCNRAQPILVFGSHGHKSVLERERTKRDCFVLMGCDNALYYDTVQAAGGFFACRNDPDAVDFVKDWLNFCTDERILTDMPNVMGLPNLEGYVEHRHDQSVLSLLAKRSSLPMYRFPSEKTNYLKMPAFRVPGEYLAEPYSVEPMENSPYGTLLAGNLPFMKNSVYLRHRRICSMISGGMRRIFKCTGN